MSPALAAVNGDEPHQLPQTLKKGVAHAEFPTVAVGDEPLTIDAFMRLRAVQNPTNPILSYPSQGTDYVDYGMQQLDVFAFRAASIYQQMIPSRQSSQEKPTVVSLLGPSDLNYVVTMLALAKLGHSILFLSTQISDPAYKSLLETTGSVHLIVHPRYQATATAVQAMKPDLQVLPIVDQAAYDFPVEAYGDTRLDRHLDPEVEKDNVCFIIHSSGSTGLPKPIFQTNISALKNYAGNMNMRGFITLPLYHNHGICNFYRSVHCRKGLHMYNADLPLARRHLLKIMREHDFEIFYGVPYALKLLAEVDEGIEILRNLKIVMYGGSACPDRLGNTLVDQGVNLVGHYGATEVGQLMTSFRPAGDKAWDYMRAAPNVKPFLSFEPRGSGMFECCVKDGWPSKVQSNRPDGSYATKDLFVPHPEIPDAWKYIARLDDTIVLVNGEKAQPVAPEGNIRSDENVAECVIFGAGRSQLGLMVIPSPASKDLSKDAYLDLIWPAIEKANQPLETWAQISKDMITVLPHDVPYPRTDKGTVIRQAFYQRFAKEIDEAYMLRPNSNLVQMSDAELRQFLRTELSTMGPQWADVPDDADFFAHGLDSLQATRLRNTILKQIDVGRKPLGNNVAFDYPSIDTLTAHLIGLRLGSTETATHSVEDQMAELIEKYSDFKPHTLMTYYNDGRSVAVTGASGSLGAHVVAQLVTRPAISRVYCLVRAKTNLDAERRVISSLRQRRVYHTIPLQARRKICALPSDLGQPDLGLGEMMYSQVAGGLASVIHCAWAVNFNMNILSFEKDCIGGVRNLINLALSARGSTPASFDFCSSVSTVARCLTRPIPEALPEDLKSAQGMGYAQSKLVAEHLCARAAQQTGLRTRVLRIGQIIGDSIHGIWNATEGIPLMMQTAKTVGALPRLIDQLYWLPVDTVAASVAEIATSDAGALFANISNPRGFSWTGALLPSLRKAGLEFEELEPKHWIERLRQSNPDPVANPPIKLLDFFASKYDRDTFSTSSSLQTQTAESISPSLAAAQAPDQHIIDKLVCYFERECWGPRASKLSDLKTVVVVAGPCGVGKSTIASSIAKRLGCTWIEGDDLHDPDAIAKMTAGTPLGDADRWSWLSKLRDRALELLGSANPEKAPASVVIACSALKSVYRNILRNFDDRTRVVFVDLQATEDVLQKRLSERASHYMSAAMLAGQMKTWQTAGTYETDVFPVDAEEPLEKLVAEIEDVLGQ